MRKIAFLAAIAALASAGVAHAQATTPPAHQRGEGRGPGGRGGPEMMEHMLFQGITLTDAQKAKLQDLHTAERAKMQANGQNGRADFDAIRDARQKGDTATAQKLMAEQRTKMEARRDEQVASLRGILTSDQQTQFDNNVAAMKKHAAGRGGGRGRPGL